MKTAIDILLAAHTTKKLSQKLSIFYSILLYFTVFYRSGVILKKMLSIDHFII